MVRRRRAQDGAKPAACSAGPTLPPAYPLRVHDHVLAAHLQSHVAAAARGAVLCRPAVGGREEVCHGGGVARAAGLRKGGAVVDVAPLLGLLEVRRPHLEGRRV